MAAIAKGKIWYCCELGTLAVGNAGSLYHIHTAKHIGLESN